MRFFLLFLIIIASLNNSFAQGKELFSKEVFVRGKDTLLYRKLLPVNFDIKKKYPVVVFLHGAGERGSDNEAQLVHGSSLFLREDIREQFPAIVIFPQCPKNDFWANLKFGDGKTSERFSFQKGGKPNKPMGLLVDLVQELKAEKYSDNDRFYIGGLSMGAMGTYELLRRKPRTFAAAFAICGGDHVENVKKYRNVPLWIFHGGKDEVVPPVKSEIVVNELRRLNRPVRFTLYPDANHNSWDPAFAEPDFLSWLFSHEK